MGHLMKKKLYLLIHEDINNTVARLSNSPPHKFVNEIE
jgi:hypothetical protein